MNKSVFINYFKGNLSKEEEKRLLEWLEESEANRDEFFKERKLWDMLLLNTSDDVVKENKMTDSLNGKSKRWFLQLGKIAAIFLLAFGSGMIVRTIQSDLKESVRINTVEVPVGQRVMMTLSDGTKVWLNSKSKFSFPDHFDRKNRSVELTGEAFFDVVHNKEVPFLVNTPKYQIKVTGTQFDVYSYENSSIFETTLVEGKVILSGYNPNAKPIELQPDEQFISDSLTNMSTIRKVNTKEFTSWIDGVYSFNDQLFSSIVQRLERYYEMKIEVDYPELMDYRFTGKFRGSDSLTVILDVVKKNKPFNYKLMDDKIIISK